MPATALGKPLTPVFRPGGIATGLVGCWPLCDQGGLTVADLSGQDNTGTLHGGSPDGSAVTWADGPWGRCLSFNGSSGYVSAANAASYAFDVANSFSLAAWVKSSDTTHHQGIVSKYSESSFKGYFLSLLNGVVLFQIQGDASTYLYKIGTINIGDNAWHFLTVTYSGTNSLAGLKIYVDGSADIISSSGSSGVIGSINTTHALDIGIRDSVGTLYFNGSLDSPLIFNRNLTPGEVATLYADSWQMLRRRQFVLKGQGYFFRQPSQVVFSPFDLWQEWEAFRQTPYVQFIPSLPYMKQADQRIITIPDFWQEWEAYTKKSPIPIGGTALSPLEVISLTGTTNVRVSVAGTTNCKVSW